MSSEWTTVVSFKNNKRKNVPFLVQQEKEQKQEEDRKEWEKQKQQQMDQQLETQKVWAEIEAKRKEAKEAKEKEEKEAKEKEEKDKQEEKKAKEKLEEWIKQVQQKRSDEVAKSWIEWDMEQDKKYKEKEQEHEKEKLLADNDLLNKLVKLKKENETKEEKDKKEEQQANTAYVNECIRNERRNHLTKIVSGQLSVISGQVFTSKKTGKTRFIRMVVEVVVNDSDSDSDASDNEHELDDDTEITVQKNQQCTVVPYGGKHEFPFPPKHCEKCNKTTSGCVICGGDLWKGYTMWHENSGWHGVCQTSEHGERVATAFGFDKPEDFFEHPDVSYEHRNNEGCGTCKCDE